MCRSSSCFLVFCLFVAFAHIPTTRAQATAGSAALFESRSIVDMPTAGVLPVSTYCLGIRIAPQGNLTADFSAAIFKNFNLALTATARNAISAAPVEVLMPAISARYRLVDEKRTFPAIAIGISSRSNGLFSQEYLQSHSMSGWISISKNFRSPLGATALHGGFYGGAHALAGYAGVEQSIGPTIALLPEIILASPAATNTLHLVMNLGARWSVSRGVTIEILAHDLTGTISTAVGRSFGVEVIRAW
ncbi:MAG: hypothetical protein U0264_12360 [Candidatus Kapaibacterium sp.]